MGRSILRGAGGDENLKSNFIWPKHNKPQDAEIVIQIEEACHHHRHRE